MGIEYYNDPVFEKLILKVAYTRSKSDVFNGLKQKKLFNWESESTAEILSWVLNTVAQGSAEKPTLFSDTSILPLMLSYKLTMITNESEDFGVFKLEKQTLL